MRCEICGHPAEQTLLGTFLCESCRGRYREFLCSGCGQRVLFHREFTANEPRVAAGVCSLCHIRGRLASIPDLDREAIRLAANRATLIGVKEVRERLGWSIWPTITPTSKA